jgi:succinate-acetate transporter protein
VRPEVLSRIVLRPVGSSLPLGFVALGAASVMLSGIQLGWVPSSEDRQAAVVLLVFVGPLQLLSSVFGFLARDSVGGTGMGLLAGSWFATGSLLLFGAAPTTSRALGLLLLFVAGALLVPMVSASFGKVLAAVVMAGAAGRFVLTGGYELFGGPAWQRASGWWGVALCGLALYGAMAFEVEDTLRATVLPTGRRGAARRALVGSLADEVDHIQHEAGVREQL